MARTKQTARRSHYSRPSYPKQKAIRRYDSSDDEESDDYDANNDDMEIEDDQQDLQNAEEIKEEENLANAPPASGDYLGPPRKPLNAFYYFKVDEFDATRAANPTLTTLEVIDVIGQKWGDLDEAKKAEYQEKFEKHKNLYEDSLKPRVWKPPVVEKSTVFTMINPEIAKMGMGTSEVKPEPPKKPLTAFFFYKLEMTPEVKEENPDAKMTEITKIIANNWKELDQETKAVYEAKHNEAKQQYEQQMKEYEEKYGTNDKKKKSKAKDSSDVSEEEDHIEEKKVIPHPPKRPLSAFFFYRDDVYSRVKEENPDAKMTDITKIIANNWKELDHETKATYEEKQYEAKQRHEQEIKEYEEKYGKIEKKKRGKAKEAIDESEEEEDHIEEEKPKEAIPLPPKRPLTGFFLYKNDVTHQVKEENPDAKITELTKIIAKKWFELDQETKAAYEVKHNEAKQRYEREMKEYEEKYGKIQKKKRSKAKEASDESEEENHSEEEKERAKPGKASLKKGKKA